MERHIEKLSGGKLQINFTLTQDEQTKFAERALQIMSAQLNVSGFRPGKVPPEIAKSRLGEEAIAQETLFQAFKEIYPSLVKKENLEVIGKPEIKLISNSPFKFQVQVAMLPEVDLGKWQKNKVKRHPVEVDKSEVEKVINEVREGRASEAAVVRPAAMGDRVEIDFEVSLDNVVIDGGKGTKYPVVLGKRQLVPEFEDNIVGLTAGEEKGFVFNFPKDYKKDLAGRKANGKVKLLQVFERILPETTDEFAKSLGKFDSVEDLHTKLHGNILEEKKEHEEQRLEREMLESLVTAAKFSDLPAILIDGEIEKMIHEFKHSMEDRGVEWAQYLQTIGKNEAALQNDFKEPAAKRVKIALLTRAFAKQEHLEADDSAIDKEISQTLQYYNGDEHMVEQFKSEDYRDYVRNVLTNRRVIEWLKEKLVEV